MMRTRPATPIPIPTFAPVDSCLSDDTVIVGLAVLAGVVLAGVEDVEFDFLETSASGLQWSFQLCANNEESE